MFLLFLLSIIYYLFMYIVGYGDTLGQYLISKGADAQIRYKEGNLYMHGTNF